MKVSEIEKDEYITLLQKALLDASITNQITARERDQYKVALDNLQGQYNALVNNPGGKHTTKGRK